MVRGIFSTMVPPAFEGHWDALAELVAPEGSICSMLGAGKLDAGRLRTTLRETLHGLSAESHKLAHQRIEAGDSIGKLAILYG